MKTKSQAFLSRIVYDGVDCGFLLGSQWNKYFFNMWALNIILVKVIYRGYIWVYFPAHWFLYFKYYMMNLLSTYFSQRKEHLFPYQWLSILGDLTSNADLEVEPLFSKGKQLAFLKQMKIKPSEWDKLINFITFKSIRK